MIKDMFKKADLILLAGLVLIGVLTIIVPASAGNLGDEVVLNKGGKEIGRYALGKDLSIFVGKDSVESTYPADQDIAFEEAPQDYNIVRIRGGEVSVIQADCRNQICVNHKPIKKSGENIICLPHRLVVEIVSQDAGKYDTVAK